MLRTVYKIARSKVTRRRSNADVDDECARNAYNWRDKQVQSWRAMRSALDVPGAEPYERHVCPCCGRMFPKKTWEQCRSDPHERCSNCNHHRFKNPNAGKNLRACKRLWI